MDRWIRAGSCNHCGFCCAHIARHAVVRDPEAVADLHFYQTRGFETVHVNGRPLLVLFAAIHAPCPQHVGNRCAVEADKPETCRAFPLVPADVAGTPCSYWFERDGARVGGTGSPYPTTEADLLAHEHSEVA